MDNSNCKNCVICVEKINRSNHTLIKCEYCDFVACRTCYETYLLSQSTPHCMQSVEQCGKIWSRNFIASNFTINYVKTKYKEHQEQILFEKEMALMPETQLVIERENNKKKRIEQCTTDINNITQLIFELGTKRSNLEKLRSDIWNDAILDDDEYDGHETKEPEKISKNKIFMHRCSNENCRGFLSSRWKCNLCETWTCSECQINVGTNEQKILHVCDENNLKTAALIKKDSKPCPKCGIIIFKINGCDQMYCTQCHTPFSWNTGKIENGNIHNPHYYEYLRKIGQNIPRNPLDNPCRRIINNEFIEDFTYLIRYLSKSNIINDDCCRILDIIRFTEDLRYRIRHNEINNEYYRIQYLKNIISEEEFKKIVQMNEKKYQKCIEQNNLYTMVHDTVSDIIFICYEKLNKIHHKLDMIKYDLYGDRLHLTSKQLELINQELENNNLSSEQILTEFDNLRIYANDCLTNISRTYHCVHKQFDETFDLVKKVNG